MSSVEQQENPYEVGMFKAVWRKKSKIKCKTLWIEDVVRMFIEYLDGEPYARVPFTCEYLEKQSGEISKFWKNFDKVSEGEGLVSKIMLDLYRRYSAVGFGISRGAHITRRILLLALGMTPWGVQVWIARMIPAWMRPWIKTDVNRVWRVGSKVRMEESDIEYRVLNTNWVHQNRVGVLNEILVRLDMFRCDPSRWALLGARRFCDETKGPIGNTLEACLAILRGIPGRDSYRDIFRDNFREIVNRGRPYEGELHKPNFRNRVFVDVGNEFRGRDVVVSNLSSSFDYLLKVSQLRPSVCLGIALAVEAGCMSHYDDFKAGEDKDSLIFGKYVAAKTLVLIAGSLNDSSRYGDKRLNISNRKLGGQSTEWFVLDIFRDERLPTHGEHATNKKALDSCYADLQDEISCARKVICALNLDGNPSHESLKEPSVYKTLCVVAGAMQIDYGSRTEKEVIILNRDVLGKANHHCRRYMRMVDKFALSNDGIISDISPIAMLLLWLSIMVNLVAPIPTVISKWGSVDGLEKYLALTAPYLVLLAILEYLSPHPEYIKSLLRGKLKIIGSRKLAWYLGLSHHDTIRLLSRSKRRNEILSPVGSYFLGEEAQGPLKIESVARPRETIGFDSVWSNEVMIRPGGAFILRKTKLGKLRVEERYMRRATVLSLEGSIPIMG